MIPSTYRMVQSWHPNANLNPDFVTGMQNHDLVLSGASVLVDGEPRVVVLRKPEQFIATTFDAGSIVDRVRNLKFLPPLAGEGARRADGGNYAEVETRGKDRPHPNLPPQAGEGDKEVHAA